MKKILFMLSILLFMTNGYAQNIEYRKILPNGLVMRTDFFRIDAAGQKTLQYALMYERADGKEDYSLLISFIDQDERINVLKGGRLKLKTAKGSVIDAIQEVDASIDEYYPDSGIKTSLRHHANVFQVGYVTISKYGISQEDLIKLTEEGLTKIRIETTLDPIECNYPEKEWIKVGRERQEINKPASLFNKWYTVFYNNIDPYTNF